MIVVGSQPSHWKSALDSSLQMAIEAFTLFGNRQIAIKYDRAGIFEHLWISRQRPNSSTQSLRAKMSMFIHDACMRRWLYIMPYTTVKQPPYTTSMWGSSLSFHSVNFIDLTFHQQLINVGGDRFDIWPNTLHSKLVECLFVCFFILEIFFYSYNWSTFDVRIGLDSSRSVASWQLSNHYLWNGFSGREICDADVAHVTRICDANPAPYISPNNSLILSLE